ncbi:EthD domain-containing protein [Hyphomonas sp. WL0036]|uniref:EthD domain-containing protein n=1 Tax=Hyphomonas sediminis TaxID=2866160 RepID=UPI001C800D45|nr:EthD domain-containing protein [Hyphomonas sediminis]
MIKLTFCLRRLPHLSREEFQRYWREQHAPLVAKHAATLGIVRYEQVHAGFDAMSEAIRASRGAPEPYDGIAEIWFESEAAMQAAGRNPGVSDAARALLEDERKFIDLANSPLWYSRVHSVVS